MLQEKAHAATFQQRIIVLFLVAVVVNAVVVAFHPQDDSPHITGHLLQWHAE